MTAAPCQGLALGPLRNLALTTPGPAWYDPCDSTASHQVTSRCGSGHAATWRVCAGCAEIIARRATTEHPHCPHCRHGNVTTPADLAITPPPASLPPAADPGCHHGDCPACHGITPKETSTP